MIEWMDRKGRLLFVARGIGNPARFGTFYRRSADGGMHRLKSPDLPMRENRNDADRDLIDYVLKYDLAPVTVSHVECP